MKVKPTRTDWALLGLLLAVAAVVRILFLQQLELSAVDPWRHLQLVDNIRSGLGFTLFADQPYIWYNPLWYYMLAAWPAQLPLELPATLLSILCVGLFYILLLNTSGERARAAAIYGALLMAAYGPLVSFTCHFGPEAFALFLTLAALLLSASLRRTAAQLAAGLLFGIALSARMNFAFNMLLFVPYWKGRRQGLGFLSGMLLPLLLSWWRNLSIISDHPFIFTWDGMATRSADFTPFSTLFIQNHPAVSEGLRRLHEQIVPAPQWLLGPEGIEWGMLCFMLCGTLCLLASRRYFAIMAGALMLLYFLVFDRTLSSNFFRVYLALFPVFFIGIAQIAAGVRRAWPKGLVWGGGALVLLVLLCGTPQLLSPATVPLELVTPPESLLTEQRYLVNSGFYHPESLIYRFPEKRFIGMPLEADQFGEFSRQYPEYDTILWHHDFSAQNDLAGRLDEFGYLPQRSVINSYGRRYTVYVKEGQLDE